MEKLKIKSHLAFNTINNEVVVIDFEAERQFHKLNELAGFIFLNMQNETTSNELVSKVCEEYDVEMQTAKSDVDNLINELKNLNLLNWVHE